MRVCFIKMYYKSCDILFTIFFTHKLVHVDSPFFYFRAASNFRIVSSLVQVHLLFTEGQTVHLIPRTTQDEICNSPVLRFRKSEVRVYYIPRLQIVFDSFGD